jgi:hypothetical protein
VTLVTPVGPPSITVSGGEPSTTNNPECTKAPTFPAASIARTKNPYSTPGDSGPRSSGDVHGSKLLGTSTVSSRHSNEAPGSLDENVNRGLSLVVEPTGPESSVVTGPTVSTVNRRDAGVASVPPALVARTQNV